MNSSYQRHFGFTREPFNVTPDPSSLYLSTKHKEALAKLVRGIKDHRGFAVLTGEVGTGKTTLIHALLQELDGNVHTAALLFNTIVSPKHLLRYLCNEFGIIPPDENQINPTNQTNQKTRQTRQTRKSSLNTFHC